MDRCEDRRKAPLWCGVRISGLIETLDRQDAFLSLANPLAAARAEVRFLSPPTSPRRAARAGAQWNIEPSQCLPVPARWCGEGLLALSPRTKLGNGPGQHRRPGFSSALRMIRGHRQRLPASSASRRRTLDRARRSLSNARVLRSHARQ
jgi:hypothetical protein